MTSPAQTEPQKLAYRIDEAVKASGLGRSFLYERMADGSLKSVKIGGRRLIMRDDLLRFLCGDIGVAGEVEATMAKPKSKPKPKSATLTGVIPFGQLELPWRRQGMSRGITCTPKCENHECDAVLAATAKLDL